MSATANVGNYSLGKGIVYFGRTDANGDSLGELDLGNAPIFAITPETETLAHYESRDGIKEKDLEVETSIGYSLKITLDEIAKENLNLAFRGEDAITSETQSDGHAVNQVVTAKLGNWVKLPHRLLDADSEDITNITGLTHYTAGTDYEMDVNVGRIRALVGGSITDDQVLYVDYTYNAYDIPTVKAASRTTIEGLIRFVGDPAIGPVYEVECWKVRLKCDADVNFISDDWATISLTGEILKDAANHPDEPFFRVWCDDEDSATPS
jgi:hypothetical protein